MAYVDIPKDLTKVKSKVLFNLTKRQLVCFGLGALIGVPIFFVTKDLIGTSASTMLMIVVMLPFFLFAMYERNGQPLEVLLKQMIQAKFVQPKERPYQTDNFYETIDQNIRIRKEVRKVVRNKAVRNELVRKEKATKAKPRPRR